MREGIVEFIDCSSYVVLFPANPEAMQAATPEDYQAASGLAALGTLTIARCPQVVVENQTILRESMYATIAFPVSVPSDRDNDTWNLYVVEWLASEALARELRTLGLAVAEASIEVEAIPQGERLVVSSSKAQYSLEMVKHDADSADPFVDHGRLHASNLVGTTSWADQGFSGTQTTFHSLAIVDATAGALRDIQHGADGRTTGSAAENIGTETLHIPIAAGGGET